MISELTVKALFILLLISCLGRAQDKPLLNAQAKDSSKIIIQQLRQGALLVRLHTRSEAIRKLKEMGNTDQAGAIQSIQREENLEIMRAFRKEYKFSKVYFIFTDSTQSMLSGKRSGIFLDDSLNVNPSITMTEVFFMIADKGNTTIHQQYDPTQAEQNLSESGYVKDAIILLTSDLQPVKKPFPNYAQETFPGNLTPSKWDEKVKSLNKKLEVFYKRKL